MGELEPEEILRVISEAKELGANALSISGGEPLLYPHIRLILREAVALGYRCSIYTSGILLDERELRLSVPEDLWKELRAICGVEKLRVIFDLQGPDADLVDHLMACDGAFALIMGSIAGARRVGFRCEAHVVPMRPNYQRIPEIASLAESCGISQLSILRFVPQGRGRDNAGALALSPSEFCELQQILLRLKEEHRLGQRKITFRLGCPVDFLFMVDRKHPSNPCRGGMDAPLILPDGSVHMCPAWKDLKGLAAGNIRKSSLATIWLKSPFYASFRELLENPQRIVGKCSSCKELFYCKGGCTAQRILAHGHQGSLEDSLVRSPDPLCPLLFSVPGS